MTDVDILFDEDETISGSWHNFLSNLLGFGCLSTQVVKVRDSDHLEWLDELTTSLELNSPQEPTEFWLKSEETSWRFEAFKNGSITRKAVQLANELELEISCERSIGEDIDSWLSNLHRKVEASLALKAPVSQKACAQLLAAAANVLDQRVAPATAKFIVREVCNREIPKEAVRYMFWHLAMTHAGKIIPASITPYLRNWEKFKYHLSVQLQTSKFIFENFEEIVAVLRQNEPSLFALKHSSRTEDF